ncbi:hypothetical protein Tsubulata_037362, partial [Turnera subulata]
RMMYKTLQAILFLLFLTYATPPCHSLPLSTNKQWIVDQPTGERVKIKCVNWPSHVGPMLAEGLDKQPLGFIASHVVIQGYNCVRFTWATYMFIRPEYANLSVEQSFDRLNLTAIKAGIAKYNPFLLPMNLLQAFETVVGILGTHGLMLILDNHTSQPIWCCGNNDGNGFFNDPEFNPQEWMLGLTTVAQRFRGKSQVVAIGLRNELRGPRQNVNDWYLYISQAAKQVHQANPDVLVFASGLSYAIDLSFLRKRSIGFNLDNKLVFESHLYSWSAGVPPQAWVDQPVNKEQVVFPNEDRFLSCFQAYAAARDLDWGLWALQGGYYFRQNQTGIEELESYQKSNVTGQITTYEDKTYSGTCARTDQNQRIIASTCDKWSALIHNGEEAPIFKAGTNFCLKAVGDEVAPVLSTDCQSQQSLWKLLSDTKLHLGAKDNKGEYLCLHMDPSNQIVTRRCICIGDDPNCKDDSTIQWFQLVPRNVMIHRIGPAILLLLFLAYGTPCSSLPLSTNKNWIVDQKTGERVKLVCVNWPTHISLMLAEGLDSQPLDSIVSKIVDQQYNCVRLTWATYMFTRPENANLTVEQSVDRFQLKKVRAGIAKNNPSLLPMTVQQAFETVVDAMAKKGLMLVLDNHVSLPIWCCDEDDGNDFFNSREFNPKEWMLGLTIVAQHFKGKSQVVAIGLRNELRGPRQNPNAWFLYMSEAAKQVHRANPNVLIMAGGMSYATDLSFWKNKSFGSNFDNKLVLEAHLYSWTGASREIWVQEPVNKVCAERTQSLDDNIAFVSTGQNPVPLFWGEFGINQQFTSASEDRFLSCFQAYAAERDWDWGLWALQGNYYFRQNHTNMEEYFGLVDNSWANIRNPTIQARLQLQKTKIQGMIIIYFILPNLKISIGLCTVSSKEWHLRPHRQKQQNHRKWVRQGEEAPIKLMNTNSCIKAVGDGVEPILTTECQTQQTMWKPLSMSKLHLGAKDDKGELMCLHMEKHNKIVTRKCICIGDDPKCTADPTSQWFKLVLRNVLLKYWRGGGGGVGGVAVGGGESCVHSRATTIVTAVSNTNADTEDDEEDEEEENGDDGPFFDLEFALPDEEEEEKKAEREPGHYAVSNEDAAADGGSGSDEEEEEEGDEREFDFTLSSGSGSSSSNNDRTDPNLALSPSNENLFFKGRLIPIESNSVDSSKPAAAVVGSSSLLKSATKIRVFLLGFKRSKATNDKANENATKEDDAPAAATNTNNKQNGSSKFFTVKFKVEEVPLVSMFTRENSKSVKTTSSTSAQKQSDKNEEQPAGVVLGGSEAEKQRFSKDVMQKYLKKVKPLYVRVSKRYGEKLRFSGQLSFKAGPSPTTEEKGPAVVAAAGEGAEAATSVTAAAPVTAAGLMKSVKQGTGLPAGLRVVCKHLGKSRSASSAAVAAVPAPPPGTAAAASSRRRDDSLLQQQDGIQGAILHCKRSFNASVSDPSHEKSNDMSSRKSSDAAPKKAGKSSTAS